jgi:5'-nucleotidase
MEAVIVGIPGVAVSLETLDEHIGEINDGPAARAASKAVRQVIENGLSHEILLNINVPFRPDGRISGLTLTRQGLRLNHSRLDERIDPRNKPYYWIGGDVPTGVSERGMDAGALAKGFVAITPLQLDLTAYHGVTDINTWQWGNPDSHTDLLGNELTLLCSD